jgi:hypothetical protein
MPVQLPAIHAPGILIPPQPEDPPTLDDVHSARLFMRSVEGSYHAGSGVYFVEMFSSLSTFVSPQPTNLPPRMIARELFYT